MNDWLEIIAALLTAISVWLTVKRNILAFPTGIVSVILSAIVYFYGKLYGDMGLQFFFGVMQFHGWWAWSAGQKAIDARIEVREMDVKKWVISTVLIGFGTVALGYFLDEKTDSPVPYLDAFLTSASVAAQILMNTRYLENWYIWLFVDIIYVPLLWTRDLKWLSLLYASFIIMSILGWKEWKQKVAYSRNNENQLKSV
jgi:nicotinamide mononucleotide transporter